MAPDSNTETYIACKLKIDNWRWAGVPFYLRTGKCLKRALDRDRHPFPPGALLALSRHARGADDPNWMILRIQPDEGIALRIRRQASGPDGDAGERQHGLRLQSYFKTAPNTGYETLLYDCMIGDATLFQRADNIEAGWRAVQPILEHVGKHAPKDFPNYAAGSDGPAAADELLARDGRAWRPLE